MIIYVVIGTMAKREDKADQRSWMVKACASEDAARQLAAAAEARAKIISFVADITMAGGFKQYSHLVLEMLNEHDPNMPGRSREEADWRIIVSHKFHYFVEPLEFDDNAPAVLRNSN